MYALIECCGKQYKVKEGDIIYFEKINRKESVTFKKNIVGF